MLVPFCVPTCILVHKLCRAFPTLLFQLNSYFSLGLSDKIEFFAAFIPEAVAFAALKDPTPNPSLLSCCFQALLHSARRHRAWLLAPFRVRAAAVPYRWLAGMHRHQGRGIWDFLGSTQVTCVNLNGGQLALCLPQPLTQRDQTERLLWLLAAAC